MNPAGVLAVLTLVIGVPLNLYVTVLLRRLHRESPNAVLRVLIVVWLALTLLAIVFGLIFINNDLEVPVLTGSDTKIITRAVILGVVVLPSFWLLWLYRERIHPGS